MVDPLRLAGGSNEITAWPFVFDTIWTLRGTVGVPGIIDADVALGLLPYSFTAYTLKVYDVPLVNPVKLNDNWFPLNSCVGGYEVATYVNILTPLDPDHDGALNDTVACWSPFTATTLVGGDGLSDNISSSSCGKVALGVPVVPLDVPNAWFISVSTVDRFNGVPTI